jgi:cell division protein FtsB
MVTHRRRRTILTAFALYTLAALFIGYFGVNAFTGNHGLRAAQNLEQQMAEMKSELSRLKAERLVWGQRVALLRSDSIDPDMLDERVRAMLDYVDPHDVAFMLRPR